MKKFVAFLVAYLIVFQQFVFSLPTTNDDYVFISNYEAEIVKNFYYFQTDYLTYITAGNPQMNISWDSQSNSIICTWNNYFLFEVNAQATGNGIILYFDGNGINASATFNLNESKDGLVLVNSYNLDEFFDRLTPQQKTSLTNISNFVKDYAFAQIASAQKTKRLTAKCKSALAGVAITLLGVVGGCIAGGLGCAVAFLAHWKAIADAGIACK